MVGKDFEGPSLEQTGITAGAGRLPQRCWPRALFAVGSNSALRRCRPRRRRAHTSTAPKILCFDCAAGSPDSVGPRHTRKCLKINDLSRSYDAQGAFFNGYSTSIPGELGTRPVCRSQRSAPNTSDLSRCNEVHKIRRPVWVGPTGRRVAGANGDLF
jgi:hypothetical protein